LDIHCDDIVYLEDPKPYIPKRTSQKGRPPSRYQTDIEGVLPKSIMETADESDWEEYVFRHGTKGEMRRQVIVRDVYTWNGEEKTARPERLIISKNPDGTNVKYSLSNDREHRLNKRQLLYGQMQRYWVERSLQDAKSELGMDEYQVRSWQGWHHHMALTFLALLFMLLQKINHKEETPLLSCSDIRFILKNTLPKKANSRKEVMKLIQQRHQRRQRDIDRYT
jgi:SRSO17 transposase